ncbi:phage tail tape measure protein [Mesorhizobium sp. 1M-11]|uniref:phage tail tape measure protein n=1 Tax=Mesorhizobium sp. 1M-11 TaxID=1529006 RepID=UPI0006C76DDA|nr:phage tail tape measure protein [Mesorhizobium sp. 1M-11]
MSNREIEAILRISSKLGNMRALETLQTKLAQVDRSAKAFNRSQTALARTQTAAYKQTVSTLAATARYLAPAAIAMGVQRSVVAYAAVERRLNRIAINADQGKEAVGGMLKTVNQISYEYAIAQDDVTTGLETLVAAGRSADDAMKFLPAVTATAQAAGAEIADIATTADAVAGSFDIAGDKMQHAFDILVTSGKQGKFELKDMAQYLPSMAPAFAALGYKGEKGLGKLAAMLQTIRQRTGSAGEAATAAQNIFQKMESEETVKKFAKFGVDLRAELAKARKEGRDLVDTFLDLSEKATKGDLSKIPQLFTDAQFQVGMRALLQGRKDMEGFQRALANVDGATMRDVNKVLADTETKLDRMASSWTRFSTSFGNTIAPPVTGLLDSATGFLDFDQAITEGLNKRGLTPQQQQTWRARNWFDKEARGLAAFEGGWRSPEGKIAEKGALALSPELPSRRQDAPVVDRKAHGLPATMVVPAGRSDLDFPLPDLKYDRFVAPSPEGMRQRKADERRARRTALAALPAASSGDASFDEFRHAAGGGQLLAGDFGAAPSAGQSSIASSIAQAIGELPGAIRAGMQDLLAPTRSPDFALPPAGGASFRESEEASMKLLRSDASGISNEIESSLNSGGSGAAQSIREAAEAVNRAGGEAGSVFKQMVAGIGAQIGQEAAQSFRASIGTVTVNANVRTSSVGSLAPATGDKGRTMPNAGGLREKI